MFSPLSLKIAPYTHVTREKNHKKSCSGLNPPSSFSFSSSTKLSDGCRRMSSLAVARPTMPPPTTATS